MRIQVIDYENVHFKLNQIFIQWIDNIFELLLTYFYCLDQRCSSLENPSEVCLTIEKLRQRGFGFLAAFMKGGDPCFLNPKHKYKRVRCLNIWIINNDLLDDIFNRINKLILQQSYDQFKGLFCINCSSRREVFCTLFMQHRDMWLYWKTYQECQFKQSEFQFKSERQK